MRADAARPPSSERHRPVSRAGSGRDERRHRRLRLRQSALGRQSVRARGARSRHRPADRRDQRSGRGCARADRVVLPGVGAFADCRRGLDAVAGMVDALEEAVRKKGRPFFGICVGMQLMAERGREYEVTEGLGWIAGEVDRITPTDPGLKIPHMGWNTLDCRATAPLLDGIAARAARAARLFRALLSAQAVAARPIWWRRADYGGAGHRDCRRATTSSARNSIRRRARSSGSR